MPHDKVATRLASRATLTVLLASVADCLPDGEGSAVSQAATGGSPVVINEFTPGSSGRIELFNGGTTTLDLSGWSVDDVAGGGYASKALAAGTVVSLLRARLRRRRLGRRQHPLSIPCSQGASNGGAPCSCPDDGNACTTDACMDGLCQHSAVPDGQSCGVGLTCQAGQCQVPSSCAPPAGPAPSVTAGSGALLLRGTVVTPTVESELASYDALDVTVWNFAPIAPLFSCE